MLRVLAVRPRDGNGAVQLRVYEASMASAASAIREAGVLQLADQVSNLREASDAFLKWHDMEVTGAGHPTAALLGARLTAGLNLPIRLIANHAVG